MSTLGRAIAIACEAHAGALGKGGTPYIEHLLRAMAYLSTEEGRIVGALHDVVKDCPAWAINRLRREKGFASE